VLLFFIVTAAQAADNTRYVTDQLEITLRSGQSLKHQIVRMLPSGTPVELLETDEQSKYSRVRATDDGTEGWVLSRYLDKQPSARERLATARQKLQQLNNDNQRLKQSLKQLGDEKTQLTRGLNEANDKNERLSQELGHIRRLSADTVAVDRENQALKAQLQHLQAQYDQAQTRIATLQDSSNREWMMVGAGVILLGMLIGLIIPKIRWRRKSSWGSL
jgi:SH3 domain protein